MLMYHLLPKDPEQHGDVLLFAERDEPLEELYDWNVCFKDEWQLKGTFRLTLESGESMLPGSMEQ